MNDIDDIGDIATLKSELAQTQLALQVIGQINQIKTGWLGNSAHELRSPLSSLMSLLQLILNDLCENPQEERDFLSQAASAAQRLMGMIDALVMVSKLDYGAIACDRQPIELSSLLGELHNLMDLPARNRNIVLNIFLPDRPLYCQGDRQKLLQALVLVLDGAIREQTEGEIQFWAEQEQDSSFLTIKVTMPFSEPFWQQQETPAIAPLPAKLTPETLRNWSAKIQLSRAMQGQIAQILVNKMGGELIYEQILEQALNMTQLRLRFPSSDPLEMAPP